VCDQNRREPADASIHSANCERELRPARRQAAEKPFAVLHHLTILLASCFVLVASFLLTEKSDGTVGFRFNESRELPQICAVRKCFGTNCPACGLTRSFAHLARGEWNESLARHRLGWLFALAAVIQIPYQIVVLKTERDAPWGRRIPVLFIWTLLVLLIGNWILGFIIV
jgi:hypothetical protein